MVNKRVFLVLVESTSSLAVPVWPGDNGGRRGGAAELSSLRLPCKCANPRPKGTIGIKAVDHRRTFHPSFPTASSLLGQSGTSSNIAEHPLLRSRLNDHQLSVGFWSDSSRRVLLWTSGSCQEEPYTAFPKSSTTQCMIHVWQSWCMWVWMETVVFASWLCVVLLLEVRRGKEG